MSRENQGLKTNNEKCPDISVILPVYNSKNVLQQCVNSILQQTYKNFELIIIDDGSTDGSGEICDSIADERVRVFHEKNGGVSKARNNGIKKARGEWVAFVDHDDFLPLNAFSFLSDFIERKDIDIIQGQVYKLRENEKWPVSIEIEEKEEPEILNIYEYSIQGGTYRTNIWGKLYRRTLLKTCNFPVGHYCEDIYFNGLYFSNRNINKIAVIKNYTYVYYVNDSSASHKWDISDFYDMIKVMAILYEKVKKRTDSKLLVSEYLQLFFSKYYSFKYDIILRCGYKNDIKRDIVKLKRKYEKELLQDSNFSMMKKVALIAMANMNVLYRMWIIMHDPTMLIYEKNIKNLLKKR